jgi:ferrochelatase
MEAVLKELRRMHWKVEARFLQHFYDHPSWIKSLAAQIAVENQDFDADFLLFSYHGLPEHHIRQFDRTGDHCLKRLNCCDRIESANRLCYRAQCFATSRALVQHLNWPNERHQVSFQSRLGRRPWIKPYTDHVLVELAERGVKRLLVTCPSFVADCLETLEEVAIRSKRDFIAAGGQELRLVPAVNASPSWIINFVELLNDKNLNWLSSSEVQSIL